MSTAPVECSRLLLGVPALDPGGMSSDDLAAFYAALPTTKKCARCKTVKAAREFGLRIRKDRANRSLNSYCRPCANASTAASHAKDPILNERRFWDSHLRRRYGITADQYDEMLAAQGGRCKLCPATHGRVGPSGRPWRLNVDHDHETGKVRGLLCSLCNRALGQLGDDEQGLLRALRYLRGEL